MRGGCVGGDLRLIYKVWGEKGQPLPVLQEQPSSDPIHVRQRRQPPLPQVQKVGVCVPESWKEGAREGPAGGTLSREQPAAQGERA